MNLIEFLAARLDEDEAVAQHDARYLHTILDGEELERARRGPARVLREVEAKRAILDAYISADGNSPRDRDRGRWDALHAAVCNLAAVYSDHPDYRQERGAPQLAADS